MGLAFDTAGTVVSQAAQELGLVSTAIADPFASTNPAILQLCALLTSLGRDIRRERQWSWLMQAYQFSTTAGQGLNPLPADFDSVIPQTQWNRTTRLPIGGPLSPQDFTAIKASLVGVVFTVLDRFIQGQQMMYPDTNTPGGYVIAYEYISRYWSQPALVTYSRSVAATFVAGQIVKDSTSQFMCVVGGTTGPAAGGITATPHTPMTDGTVTWAFIGPWTAGNAFVHGVGVSTSDFIQNNGQIYFCSTSGTTGVAALGTSPFGNGIGIADGTAAWTWFAPYSVASPTADGPTKSTDTLWFDSLLLCKGLMNLFRRRKGLDTSATQPEYEDALMKAKNADSYAPVLSINPRSGFPPLIGPQSVPQTGVGT